MTNTEKPTAYLYSYRTPRGRMTVRVLAESEADAREKLSQDGKLVAGGVLRREPRKGREA